jgi:hypothetical protein
MAGDHVVDVVVCEEAQPRRLSTHREGMRKKRGLKRSREAKSAEQATQDGPVTRDVSRETHLRRDASYAAGSGLELRPA